MIRLELEIHDEDDFIELVNIIHGFVSNLDEILKGR